MVQTLNKQQEQLELLQDYTKVLYILQTLILDDNLVVDITKKDTITHGNVTIEIVPVNEINEFELGIVIHGQDIEYVTANPKDIQTKEGLIENVLEIAYEAIEQKFLQLVTTTDYRTTEEFNELPLVLPVSEPGQIPSEDIMDIMGTYSAIQFVKDDEDIQVPTNRWVNLWHSPQCLFKLNEKDSMYMAECVLPRYGYMTSSEWCISGEKAMEQVLDNIDKSIKASQPMAEEIDELLYTHFSTVE